MREGSSEKSSFSRHLSSKSTSSHPYCTRRPYVPALLFAPDKYDRFYPPSSQFPSFPLPPPSSSPTSIGLSGVAATFYKVRDFPASMRTRILCLSASFVFLLFPPPPSPPALLASLHRSESLFPIAFVFPKVRRFRVAFQLARVAANTMYRPIELSQ